MRIFLFIIYLFINQSIFAQNWMGKVIYRRIVNLDSTSSNNDSIGINSILYFNATNSYYVYNSIVYNIEPETSNFVSPKSDEHISIRLKNHEDNVGEVFSTDFTKKTIEMREFIFNKPFLSSEVLPPIQWILLKDEKYFGALKCQKAKTTFRGRNYEVWFCPDIPVSAGPWKLQGLPGLIIEASDTKKEIQFLFNAIELPVKNQITIEPLSKATGKRVNFSEYKTIYKTETEKMVKFLKSSADKGANIDISVKYYELEKSHE